MKIHKKLKKNFKRSISCLSDYFRDDQIFGVFFANMQKFSIRYCMLSETLQFLFLLSYGYFFSK